MNEVKNGMPVWFFDSHCKQHDALVTCVHGESREVDGVESHPSINLIYVSDNPEKSDSYGQQIERPTSVVHGDDQSAHGMYWTFVQ